MLLQAFDEGHLTDAQGNRVDFRNTIFIMTSNLGAHAAQRATINLPREEAVEKSKDIMSDAISSYFAPEFLNRVDEIITFNTLSEADMSPIIDIQLREVSKLLEDRNIIVEMQDDARHWSVFLSEKYFFMLSMGKAPA